MKEKAKKINVPVKNVVVAKKSNEVTKNKSPVCNKVDIQESIAPIKKLVNELGLIKTQIRHTFTAMERLQLDIKAMEESFLKRNFLKKIVGFFQGERKKKEDGIYHLTKSFIEHKDALEKLRSEHGSVESKIANHGYMPRVK